MEQCAKCLKRVTMGEENGFYGNTLPLKHTHAHTINTFLRLCNLMLGHVVQVVVVKKSLKWIRTEQRRNHYHQVNGTS